MSKLSFKEFQELCEHNLDKKHIPEILETTTNSDCLFNSGIIMPNDHITSIYEMRLEIAKKHSRSPEDYIQDFENTVHNLKNTQSTNLAITLLDAEHYGFIVFYEPESKEILGVLKYKNASGLEAMEQYNTDIVNKGFSSAFQKYSKGEFVKEWK